MRTLALYWPALSSGAGSATGDRAVRLRSARHALGRLSPLVAGSDSYGLIEIGIDGLQARSGSERDIAAIALRACSPSIPISISPYESLPATSGERRPSACRALRSRAARSSLAPPAARLSVGQ